MTDDPQPKSSTGLLTKAIEEKPGTISSVRLQMLVVLFMVAVVPLGVWAGMSLRAKDGKPVDIPGGVVTLCTLLAGASIGGKVFQQRSE